MRRVMLGVLVSSLLAGGCRQLFGIDDTEVAGDGPPQPPDARPDGSTSCADEHLLCMDFDSPENGFGQLIELETGHATIAEATAFDAPSPPNVLLATVGDGDAMDAAYGGAIFGASELRRNAFDLQARVTGDCEPVILLVQWNLGGTDSYGLQIVAGREEISVTVTTGPIAPVTVSIPGDATTWTPIGLDLDLIADRITLRVGEQSIDEAVPGLSDAAEMQPGFAVGMILSTAHPACTVELDNVIIDPY